MAMISLLTGAVLVLVGLGGYVATGMHSFTALIPAVFGILLVALGAGARNESRRKLFMHLAAGIALLGILGTARGLTKLPALLGGEEVARPGAVVSQSVTAVVLVLFLAACIRSFVAARSSASAT